LAWGGGKRHMVARKNHVLTLGGGGDNSFGGKKRVFNKTNYPRHLGVNLIDKRGEGGLLRKNQGAVVVVIKGRGGGVGREKILGAF